MPLPSLIDWPAELGCAQRAGYGGAPVPMFTTLDVEDGPPRYRLVSSEQKRDYAMTFFFTEAQLAAYEEFVFTTLEGGTLWFNMDVLTGLGMVSHLVHLTGNRTVRPHPELLGKYIVELSFEAYSTGTPIPPPFAPDPDPVDAQVPATPSTDIYDGRAVTDTRPTDFINALTPAVF